jgi:L-lactate dehydrogenase complex protein LldE
VGYPRARTRPRHTSSLQVGLFIPCYVDQLRPETGLACVDLLDEQGIDFVYPTEQTCCGQALLSAGAAPQARVLARRFVEIFGRFDHVVTPSGSCAATMRTHLPHLVPGPEANRLAGATFELCEYLVDVQEAPALGGRLDTRIGVHESCHALRALRLGTSTELQDPPRRDPVRVLLDGIAGVEIVELDRRDECCGFGGVFALDEEAVSSRMGLDRLDDHVRAGAEVITSTDVSCLLHLDGLASRQGIGIRFQHVAELLAGRLRA